MLPPASGRYFFSWLANTKVLPDVPVGNCEIFILPPDPSVGILPDPVPTVAPERVRAFCALIASMANGTAAILLRGTISESVPIWMPR